MQIHCLEYNNNTNNIPSAAQVPSGAGGRNPMLWGMSEDELWAIMNNPMMDMIMSNPEFMQSFIQMNPQLRELMNTNPEM